MDNDYGGEDTANQIGKGNDNLCGVVRKKTDIVEEREGSVGKKDDETMRRGQRSEGELQSAPVKGIGVGCHGKEDARSPRVKKRGKLGIFVSDLCFFISKSL